MKFPVIIFSFLINQLVFAQGSKEFEEILKMNSGDRLSDIQTTFFFDTSSEPYDFVLFDSVVQNYEQFLLISTTHKKKNKYRYQSSTFLTSLKPNGELVDRLRVMGGLSDCSFSNYSAIGLFDNKNLSIYTTEQKFDCGTETLLNRIIQVSEYIILEHGSFKRVRSKNVEPNRINRWISLRLCTIEELRNYSSDSLAILRNEIFASYGYKFKSKEWQDYFNKTNWYKPLTNSVSSEELLIVERRNLDLIKQLEKRNYTQH